MTTNEYLDAAKKRLNVASDYALAKWLEIKPSRISEYRSGKHGMDNYTAARLANLLEINPLQVIADTNAEREKCDKRREFWQKLVKTQTCTTLVIVLLFSGLTVLHETVEHSQNIPYAQCAIGAGTGRAGMAGVVPLERSICAEGNGLSSGDSGRSTS